MTPKTRPTEGARLADLPAAGGPDVPARPHPLPAAGGSYVLDEGALKLVRPPTREVRGPDVNTVEGGIE